MHQSNKSSQKIQIEITKKRLAYLLSKRLEKHDRTPLKRARPDAPTSSVRVRRKSLPYIEVSLRIKYTESISTIKKRPQLLAYQIIDLQEALRDHGYKKTI